MAIIRNLYKNKSNILFFRTKKRSKSFITIKRSVSGVLRLDDYKCKL